MKLSASDKNDFDALIGKYSSNPSVLKMKEYIAHGKISVYEHSLNVALLSYILALGKKVNIKTVVVGAMLHDFYLYDWHDASIKVPLFQMHGFTHPLVACQNAIKEFGIDIDTQLVISSHMWPLTITRFPKSKEAMIVCFADKLVALKETLFKR